MRDATPFAYHDAMRSLSVSAGVPLVDLVPLFRAGGAEALFADVVHANARGNRLAAKAISGALHRIHPG